MAFILSNFSTSGNQTRRGLSPQQFIYTTADTTQTVIGANYFLPIVTYFELGDMIFVTHVDNVAAPTTWTNSIYDVTTLTKYTAVTVTKKIPA
jgi:hypothetical protein